MIHCEGREGSEARIPSLTSKLWLLVLRNRPRQLGKAVRMRMENPSVCLGKQRTQARHALHPAMDRACWKVLTRRAQSRIPQIRPNGLPLGISGCPGCLAFVHDALLKIVAARHSVYARLLDVSIYLTYLTLLTLPYLHSASAVANNLETLGCDNMTNQAILGKGGMAPPPREPR